MATRKARVKQLKRRSKQTIKQQAKMRHLARMEINKVQSYPSIKRIGSMVFMRETKKHPWKCTKGPKDIVLRIPRPPRIEKLRFKRESKQHPWKCTKGPTTSKLTFKRESKQHVWKCTQGPGRIILKISRPPGGQWNHVSVKQDGVVKQVVGGGSND